MMALLCFMVAVVGTSQALPAKIAFGAAAAVVGQALVPQSLVHQLMVGLEELAAQLARQAHSLLAAAEEGQRHPALVVRAA
jgi:hypothetical protein